jgi:tetratricopeptide (TPR) repeat protein
MYKTSTTNCLRCGAPMNPPRSGHYNCEFCGASYFAGGVLSRGVYYIKRLTQTKGFNSSIVIPAGLGSLLLVLLIFRYPSFQKNKVENVPIPTRQENTFEEDVIKESIKETIRIIPQLINQEITKRENIPTKIPVVPKKPITFLPEKNNRESSQGFKTVERNDVNSLSFKMKIAGTIGFRPSIKTVNYISRRNSIKKINSRDKSNYYFEQGYEKKIMGDFNGALSDYSRAISINPNDPDYYYFRGWLRAKPEVRDLPGAASDLEMLNKLEPNNVQNLLDLATVYSRALYPFEAYKLLDMAQRIEPDNGNIVWWRGIFTIKSGKLPVGCRYVREARRMKASDYNPTMLKACN